MKNISAEIIKNLSSRKQKVSTAESCTGGLISVRFSQISGASKVFSGSIIAYSEYAKIHVLGINESLIKTHGIVSEEVAAKMAIASRNKFASDWALSTTGYSGPTGGDEKAQLGTLCVAISGPHIIFTQRYLLENLSRLKHQEKSCEILLKLFLDMLQASSS